MYAVVHFPKSDTDAAYAQRGFSAIVLLLDALPATKPVSRGLRVAAGNAVLLSGRLDGGHRVPGRDQRERSLLRP